MDDNDATDECMNNNEEKEIVNAANFIEPFETKMVGEKMIEDKDNNKKDNKDTKGNYVKDNSDTNNKDNVVKDNSDIVNKDDNDKGIDYKANKDNNQKEPRLEITKEQLVQSLVNQEPKSQVNDFLITGVDIEVKPKADLNLKTPVKSPTDQDNASIINTSLRKQLDLQTEVVKGASHTVDHTLVEIKEDINAEVLSISNNQRKINGLLHSNILDFYFKPKPKLSSTAKKTISALRHSQEAIKNNIFTLNQNQRQLKDQSFLNVSNSVIEDTIRQSNLKKINAKKQLLLNRLEGIQAQVDRVINEDITLRQGLDRKSLIKAFLDNFESDAHHQFEQKAIEYESQHLLRQEKMINDITAIQDRRQKEFEASEQHTLELKEKHLFQQKKREKEAISKRRKDIEVKMKKTKNYINLTSKRKENNYLFYKMQNKYEQSEQKLVDRIKLMKRNKIVSKEEIDDLERRREKQRIKLRQDSKEKETLMREMWKNRSLIIPEYRSPIEKMVQREMKQRKEEEELKRLKVIVMVKEKQLFGEKKVPMPTKNDKLRKERETRIVRIEKKGQMKMMMHRRVKKESLVHIPIPKPKPKSQSLIKSNSAQLIVNKPKRFIKSPKSLVTKPLRPPNYLIELKKEREKVKQLKSTMGKTDWTKIIDNPKGNSIQNIQLIKAQSEVLEEKVKNKKAFLRCSGGYGKNPQLGDDLSDLLLESIRAKLAIITTLRKNIKEDNSK